MPRRASLVLSAIVVVTAFAAHAARPSGDAKQGAQLYRACAACHSLTPDRNMTGPSRGNQPLHQASMLTHERITR